MERFPFFHRPAAGLRGSWPGRLVVLAVMAVLLYQLTGIFYQALGLGLAGERLPRPEGGGASAQAVRVALREPPEEYRVIAERNLFRTATAATAGRPADPAPPFPPELPVDLRGTVAGGRFGFAIIEERRTRRQRLVRKGDWVHGAQVVAIRRNTLVLAIGDRETTLSMDARRDPSPARPSVPSVPSVAAVPAVAAAGAGPIVVARRTLQEAMANLGTLLTQARLRPNFRAGHRDGFIIDGIRPGSFYQRMGIANGDIIHEVNRRRIGSLEDVMGLLNTLRSGASLSLGIVRRDRPETLEYRFE